MHSVQMNKKDIVRELWKYSPRPYRCNTNFEYAAFDVNQTAFQTVAKDDWGSRDPLDMNIPPLKPVFAALVTSSTPFELHDGYTIIYSRGRLWIHQLLRRRKYNPTRDIIEGYILSSMRPIHERFIDKFDPNAWQLHFNGHCFHALQHDRVLFHNIASPYDYQTKITTVPFLYIELPADYKFVYVERVSYHGPVRIFVENVISRWMFFNSINELGVGYDWCVCPAGNTNFDERQDPYYDIIEPNDPHCAALNTVIITR